jgi:hypothetical protein
MHAARSASAAARAPGARRLRILKTIALTMAALCIVPSLGVPARAEPMSVQLWGLLNEKCKDGLPDDPKTAQACAKREQYTAKLQRRGCLFHEDGGGWWKCPR